MEIANRIKYSRLLDLYGALLTDKQRDIAELSYNADMSLAEISEQYNDITRQAIHDTLSRVEKFLDDCESKLHLMAKGEDIERSLKILEKNANVNAIIEIERIRSLL